MSHFVGRPGREPLASPFRRGAVEGDVLLVLFLSRLAGSWDDRSLVDLMLGVFGALMARLLEDPDVAFVTSRYFCRRLLGFSWMVYSINWSSMSVLIARLSPPEIWVCPSALLISAREKEP